MKQSPTPPVCQHALLARSQVGQVSICPDCGVVHVSLQAISVRLTPSAFLELSDMVSHAQKRLLSMPTNDHPSDAHRPAAGVH